MQPSFLLALLIVVAVALAIEDAVRVRYHYTDKAGYNGISNDGYIKISDREDDARDGKGVYLTKLDPCTPTLKLLYNNFGNESSANEPKIAYFFNCTFQQNDKNLQRSERAFNKTPSRDVWLYSTSVSLTFFNCTKGERAVQRRRRRSVVTCRAPGSAIIVEPKSTSGAVSLESESSFLVAASLVLTGLGAVPWN